MKRLKQIVLLVFTVVVVATLVGSTVGAYQAGKKTTKPAEPAKPATDAPATSPTGGQNALPTAPGGKYAQPFDHFAKVTDGKARDAHDKLSNAQSCEICHARADNNPKTPLPYHDSCVRCHANQFTDPKLEVCADCHSKPYSAQPGVNPMRQLVQFGMEFSHASHKPRENFKCETCHNTPADGKTAKSTYPGHLECFTCHTFNDSKAKGNCNECHNTKAEGQKFRERGQHNIAYNLFKFNHGQHLAFGKRCDECHSVVNTDATTKTDISRITLVFSKDATVIHKSVCFKCHDPNPTGTGSQCAKCHVRPVGTLSASNIR